MVNWEDSSVQLFSANAAIFSADVSTGAYLWEFLTSFAFDWDYFTRRRPFRWTVLPYFIARYTAATAFMIYICPSNVFWPVRNCRAVWQALYACAHLSLASSSLLLVIRVIALTQFNRWATGFLACLWLAEFGTQIHSLVLIRGTYVPQLLACIPNNTVVSRPYMLVSFALHFACLAMVLVILLRRRGAGLCRLLLSQGIVYFVVSMLGFTSTSVLLLLNLNEGMTMSFQVPTVAALAICATRMYRGLVTYANPTEDAFTLTTSQIDWRANNVDASGSEAGARTTALPALASQFHIATSIIHDSRDPPCDIMGTDDVASHLQ